MENDPERAIIESYLDDVKAERDRLKEQLAKASTPLFKISLGLDQIWSDLVRICDRSDGWLFGLWVLFATVFGVGAWAVVYSVVCFWQWMLK